MCFSSSIELVVRQPRGQQQHAKSESQLGAADPLTPSPHFPANHAHVPAARYRTGVTALLVFISMGRTRSPALRPCPCSPSDSLDSWPKCNYTCQSCCILQLPPFLFFFFYKSSEHVVRCRSSKDALPLCQGQNNKTAQQQETICRLVQHPYITFSVALSTSGRLGH